MSAPRTVERYIESPGSRKKRRRIVFVCLILFGIFCVLLGVMWVVTRSGFFAVEHIHVDGAGLISNGEATQDAEIAVLRNSPWRRFLGTGNMLIWPSVISSDEFKLTPQIANMAITKDYWNKNLTIAVHARISKGIWCNALTDGAPDTAHASGTITTSFACFMFDQTGFLYEGAPHAEGGLLHVIDDYTGRKIGVGNIVLPQKFTLPTLSIFSILEQSELGIKEIRLEDLALEEVSVVTYNGPKLLFSLRFDADDTLPVLLSLQSRPGFKNLQYVDFRTQGRVYYR